MKTNKKMLASAIAAVAVMAAGCGGGGEEGSSSAEVSPEGVYGGTISGATTSAFQMLILEDGELWALYGAQGTSVFYVRGFIQGKGSWSQGSYSATDVRDFGYSPPPAGRLTAGFNAAAGTISGTVTDGVGTVSFSGGPITSSLYSYNAAASLASIAGAWTLTELGGQRLAMSIGADGQFSASGSGCTMSGTVTPRPSGKNVFNVALTFGPAPCQLPLQPAKGIAVLTPLANGQSQLIVAATDLSRSTGAAAFGTR